LKKTSKGNADDSSATVAMVDGQLYFLQDDLASKVRWEE